MIIAEIHSLSQKQDAIVRLAYGKAFDKWRQK
jgi:hypothetical protein